MSNTYIQLIERFVVWRMAVSTPWQRYETFDGLDTITQIPGKQAGRLCGPNHQFQEAAEAKSATIRGYKDASNAGRSTGAQAREVERRRGLGSGAQGLLQRVSGSRCISICLSKSAAGLGRLAA